jgi:hypothetical protein
MTRPLRAIAPSDEAPAPPARTCLHEPFSWLAANEKCKVAAERNADCMDAFRGIATCLELIEMSNLDREMAGASTPDSCIPVLNVRDTGQLMRLAILVAKEWGNKADHNMLQDDAEGQP